MGAAGPALAAGKPGVGAPVAAGEPGVAAPAAAPDARDEADALLPPGPETGRDLVRAHCTVCHSARLVAQSRASREGWRALIAWMQETQGLWRLAPAVQGPILDYLSTALAPAGDAAGRRPPLPPRLRPPTAAELAAGAGARP